MRKIPTLFVRDSADRRYVLPDVTPGCDWVIAGEGTPTRKYDGTCVLLDEEGAWWARREIKPGKQSPPGWYEVDSDDVTGKRVGWEPIGSSPFVKFFDEAVKRLDGRRPGTYELIGPKVNGNPEQVAGHQLIAHSDALTVDAPRTYGALAAWLAATEYEGVVWHHPDGRMAKLKKRDFPRAADSQP
jgi:hypothetical protein